MRIRDSYRGGRTGRAGCTDGAGDGTVVPAAHGSVPDAQASGVHDAAQDLHGQGAEEPAAEDATC